MALGINRLRVALMVLLDNFDLVVQRILDSVHPLETFRFGGCTHDAVVGGQDVEVVPRLATWALQPYQIRNCAVPPSSPSGHEWRAGRGGRI